jgi:hypothetical protein
MRRPHVARAPAVLTLALFALVAGACTGKNPAEKIAGVPLSNGTAHVEVTGGIELSFDAPLERAMVGQVATVFVYRSESNDLFSITGLGIDGPTKTSNTLPLVVTSGDLSATSAEGECTIELTHGDENSEDGTATCTNLDSNQGTISLEATFSASP